MKTKICKTCNEPISIDGFIIRQGEFSDICRNCEAKIRKKVWYENNKERLKNEMTEEQRNAKKDYMKKYHVEHKEQQKKYIEDNKERIKAYRKEYDSRPDVISRKKQYVEDNKEKLKAYKKAYGDAHKEQKKEYDRIYNMRKRKKICANCGNEFIATNNTIYCSDECYKERYSRLRNETFLRKYGTIYPGSKAESKTNSQFAELLNKENIVYVTEYAIKEFIYDFYIECCNLVIEINPNFTHSTLDSGFYKPKTIEYHYNKTNTAVKNNYLCLNIWQWDDWISMVQIIKDIIKNKITLNYLYDKNIITIQEDKTYYDYSKYIYKIDKIRQVIVPQLQWGDKGHGLIHISEKEVELQGFENIFDYKTDNTYDAMIQQGFLPLYDCGYLEI